jgi:hypothetical protein
LICVDAYEQELKFKEDQNLRVSEKIAEGEKMNACIVMVLVMMIVLMTVLSTVHLRYNLESVANGMWENMKKYFNEI